MMALAALIRGLRCRWGWCLGRHVSGLHAGMVWVGWQCDECGAVKYYAPAKSLV